jgi:hypothetical protein
LRHDASAPEGFAMPAKARAVKAGLERIVIAESDTA